MNRVPANCVIALVLWMVLGFDSVRAMLPYGQAVLALRPVGFWPLNETNGTVAFDDSGNGNNGTYQSGATLGEAGVPNPPFVGFASNSLAAGFSSSASNSWVTLANLPINSANVTITEWIYPTDPNAVGTTFWSAGQNAGFSLAYFDNAALGYNWHGGDGAQWTYTAFTPPVNQWSFVALVITPTDAIFYMGNTNGLFSLTNDDDNTAVNFTTGTTIGGDGSNDGTGLNGTLSDVAVFNYSLTPAQITQLYLDANGGAPLILSQSASQTNFAGSTLQLAVSVAGNSPFNYQWKAGAIGSGTYTNVVNGGNISGATSATLIITNATFANAADYIVVVGNSQGTATSANPTTEGIANLSINGPSPTSTVLYPGGNVNFSANVIAPGPITYFWETNGVPFNLSTSGNNGVTNISSILSISNVGTFDSSSYYFVATNIYGAVTSAPAILTVLPSPTVGSYAQAVLSNGPVAYWQFNELCGTNAYDSVGGYNGIYGDETLYGWDGPSSPQWPGFEPNNHAFIALPGFSESTVTVPASEALDLDTNTETMTAWVYFYEEGQSGGIVFQRENGEAVGFGIGTNGDLEYNWNNDPGTTDWDSGLKLPLLQWAFVVWVVTPTNSIFYVYSPDGQNSAALTHNHVSTPFSGVIGIGCDPQGGDGEPIFNGVIDEVAIFNYSLSPAAINQLYTAALGAPVPPYISLQPQSQVVYQGGDVQFTVGANGTPPLFYQWQKNGSNLGNGGNISGVSTPTLNISNVMVGNTGNYTVIVSNQFGSETSIVATATIAIPTSYNASVLALNPVGFWPLNETSGTTAFDDSGHGNNGTYQSGVTLGVSGVPNPPFVGFASNSLAAGFSGSLNNNSCVTLTNLPINSASVTIAEWIYPTDPSAIGTTFWNAGQNAGFSYGYYNNAALGYNWHGGDASQWTYTAFTPPVDQWSFVALVITPTNAVFYMGNSNGLSSLTNNDDDTAVNFTTGTSIGGPDNGSTTGFNGSLSDVAVFNYSLAPAQITQLYDNGVMAIVPATNPTNITVKVSGSTINLSWPEDHLGWILQSNSVDLADTNFWFDIPNSQNGTSLTITIYPGKTNVFYRLRYP